MKEKGSRQLLPDESFYGDFKVVSFLKARFGHTLLLKASRDGVEYFTWGTSISYSEETGMIYYLDRREGHLYSLAMLPKGEA